MRGTAHFRRKFFSAYDGSFVNGPDKSLYNSGSKKGSESETWYEG